MRGLKDTFSSLSPEDEEPKTALGYRPLTDLEKKGLTVDARSEDHINDDGRMPQERVGYLQGLRGLVAIQMTLWSFFLLFAPAAATAYDLDGTYPAPFLESAPGWQTLLRRLLSPLLWDGGLQSTFYIILSGRVVVHTFLERRTASTLAGSAFRRPLRLLPPLLLSFLFVALLLYINAFHFAYPLGTKLHSRYATPPERWDDAQQLINAFLSLFFETTNSKTTRAVQFMPVRGTWWIFPRIFQQSFTVYIFALLLPFTVRTWKALLLGLMILSTWWLGLFAWYTLTGLALAELSIVYDLSSLSDFPVSIFRFSGLSFRKVEQQRRGSRSTDAQKTSLSLPLIALPYFLLLIGILAKYVIVLLPSHRDNELLAHSSWKTGGLNRDVQPALTAYPRLDDWLVSTGFLFLVEMSSRLRRFLDNPFLRWWGRNSLLLFLLVPSILLSFGSFLYIKASQVYPLASSAKLLCLPFFLALPIALITVEMTYWTVERPTLYGARRAWRWFTR